MNTQEQILGVINEEKNIEQQLADALTLNAQKDSQLQSANDALTKANGDLTKSVATIQAALDTAKANDVDDATVASLQAETDKIKAAIPAIPVPTPPAPADGTTATATTNA